MSPNLTIAIPTMNRALLLGWAIESALAQTCAIIVSDKGAVDETQAVIQRYAGRPLRTFHYSTMVSTEKRRQSLIEQGSRAGACGLRLGEFTCDRMKDVAILLVRPVRARRAAMVNG